MGMQKRGNADATNSTASKNAQEVHGVDALFQRYADNDSVIGPENIENLCVDLGIEVTDVKILMLAWKMQAARHAYFTLEEWRRGLKALNVDTIDKLRKTLFTLEEEIYSYNSSTQKGKIPKNLENFHNFAFQYSLIEEGEKYLDIESACMLLMIVLEKPHYAKVKSFVEYLKVDYPSFENYDLSLGWPLMFDNYVEWVKKIHQY